MKFKLKNMDSHVLKRIIAGSLQLVICLLTFSHVVSTQEFVKPPDTLIVEGVPRIPSFIKKRFDQNLRWKDAEFKGWNRTTGSVRGITSGLLFSQLAPDGGQVNLNYKLPYWDYLQFRRDGDDSFLLTSENPKTNDRVLYMYDAKTGKPVLLTNPSEVTTVWSYEWSHDHRSVFYSNQNSTEGVSEIFSLNLRTMERELLAKYKGDANYLIDANERYLIVKNYLSNSRAIYYLFDLASRETKPFTDDKAYVNQAKLSNDGSGVWFFSNKEGGFHDFYFHNIKTNVTKKLNGFDQNMSDFTFSTDETLLALKISEYGADRIRIFRMDGKNIGKELAGPKLPLGVIGKIDWRNNDEIGFDFQSPTVPTEIKSYHLENKGITSWTKSKAGGRLDSGMKDSRLIEWKSFDGRRISGFLLEPKSSVVNVKHPVIIDIHGGPDSQFRPVFNSYLANLALEVPAVIISPNVRGSTGFGKEFLDLDNFEKRADAVKDLQFLLEWIEKQPNLDKNKIFVRGTSYGAFLGFALGLNEQRRIKGVIAYVPLISLREYLKFVSGDRRRRDELEFGRLQNNELMEKNEELSLLYPGNLKNWRIPILLVAGQNDKSASIVTVELLKEKLEKNDIPVWYIKAKNEGHSWGHYSNYGFYESAVFAFIKQKSF